MILHFRYHRVAVSMQRPLPPQQMQSNVQQYPLVPMEKYGQNPYGDNIWRIILASSRRFIVAGLWGAGATAGQTCASEEPLYPSLFSATTDNWILEKWISAMEFAGCSPEVWEWRYQSQGPYPERGDYVLSHVFETCGPSDANLDKLISWINEGKKRSFQEIRNGIQDSLDYEKKEASRIGFDREYDKLSAHLDYAMVGPYATRGTKTAPCRLSAAQAGLPAHLNHAKGAEVAPGLQVKCGVASPKIRKRALVTA